MDYRETIVVCDPCGAAQVGFVGEGGDVSVNGASGCRRCGRTEFEKPPYEATEGR